MSFSCRNIAIVSAARTPIGAFLGSLSSVSAPALGAQAIAGCLAQTTVSPEAICEVIMGCVLPAGSGQAPARQAARGAAIGDRTPATTLNKVCGSGMKAVMSACAQLLSGEADRVIAGGMESMSRAPYLQKGLRQGQRLGHGTVQDHLFTDGLEDAQSGQLMGVFAEQLARQVGISREQMDHFALESLRRTRQAQAQGIWQNEITPLSAAGTLLLRDDELPGRAQPDKVPRLKPVFARDGAVTAANASALADGAAALLLMREDQALAEGLAPLARIRGYASYAGEPAAFTQAPAQAIGRLLDALGWACDDVDLWEINEAFAVVVLQAMQTLKLDPARVNLFGGACALGHPLGATGARIIVTLLNALRHSGGTRGIAALCIGGGEATAIAVELLPTGN